MSSDHDVLAAQRLNVKLQTEIVRRDVQIALKAAGGSVELLSPIVEQRARLVEQPSGFAVRVDEDGESFRVEHYVEKMKQDPRFMPAFGDSVANPWAHGCENLTDQMRIERQNPAHAARLKAKAATSKPKM